jgi:hypothetical protein
VEGEGGSSTITGTIKAIVLNSAGVEINTFAASNHDVYIVYGSGETVHDDKTETSYDGKFEFRFLEKGNYTIYTYQDCNTCASGEEVVLQEVTISNSKETVNVGTIDVID